MSRSANGQTRPKAPRRTRRKVPVWQVVLWSAAAAVSLSCGMIAWLLYQLETPSVNLSVLDQTSSPTQVFDRYGKLAFIIPAKGVVDVPLHDIPVRLQQALIATEDAAFYHQPYGFSIRGYFRAAFYDLLHHSVAQGASTITQQLAKFVFLSDAKTFTRKWKQLILAAQISKTYTKAQILDMYFNHVYFGNDATGIAEAAYTYFNLQPSQLHGLTLAQCALLAGLPQAPSLYDPLVNPKLALTRRNEVLLRMYEVHDITRAQMLSAKRAPLELTPNSSGNQGIPPQYNYFRDYLYQEFAQLGLSTQLLTRGGLKIYTELDPALQQATYNAVNNPAYYPTPLSSATEQMQGAGVMLDPQTGGIMALVGGRQNQYTFRGFDYATMTQRSPGSAMKPLVAYGPALQTGQWNANSALLDGINNRLSFGSYTVGDWENHPTDKGYVSLRWALAESWNAPAVWLLNQIGIQTGIQFAEKAGINLSNPANHNLTIALGNVVPGISPLTLADAYAAFDNYGLRMPAHAIDQVVSRTGVVLYQYNAAPVQVMSAGTARDMTALLENNVTNGIVAGAAAPGHAVAGKTGSVAFTNTSQTDSDLWVAAYTPNVVGAIWEGYPNTTLANSIAQWSSKYPPMMFSAILRSGWPPHGGKFPLPPATGSAFPASLPSSVPSVTTSTYGGGGH